MSILPLLYGIIDHIYNICKDFMWTEKHHSIIWSEMCKPKEDGVLRFKNLKTWNESHFVGEGVMEDPGETGHPIDMLGSLYLP